MANIEQETQRCDDEWQPTKREAMVKAVKEGSSVLTKCSQNESKWNLKHYLTEERVFRGKTKFEFRLKCGDTS